MGQYMEQISFQGLEVIRKQWSIIGVVSKKEGRILQDLLYFFVQFCFECFILRQWRWILFRFGCCLLSICSGQLFLQMNFDYLLKRRQYYCYVINEEIGLGRFIWFYLQQNLSLDYLFFQFSQCFFVLCFVIILSQEGDERIVCG